MDKHSQILGRIRIHSPAIRKRPLNERLIMTQTPLHEAPALIPATFTLERYHQMIAAGFLDDESVELLHGVIVEMSPEGEPHANRSTKAANHLRRLLGDNAEIREAKPITFPTIGSEPEPDIAIVQLLEDEYDRHHPYPDNIFWVIEYSNTSLRKDLEIKSKLYASVGILEYWIINLRKMELIVMRDPMDGEYQTKTTLTQGQINPLAFPHVAVDIARLLGSP
jgi:Uma2 family endonuclease